MVSIIGPLAWSAVVSLVSLAPALAQWSDHEIRQLNGRAQPLRYPARAQVPTERWGRSVQMPYLIYMPERDELLLLGLSERPTRAVLSRSIDRGATWSEPAFAVSDKPDLPGSMALTYLGSGKAIMVPAEGTKDLNMTSDDFGRTWRQRKRRPAFPGMHFIVWDPWYVPTGADSGQASSLLETGYVSIGDWEKGGYSQGVIRASTDGGQTWSETTKVPQWKGWNEIVVARAKNGDLLAACRSDSPSRFRKHVYDNYSGLGVSLSKDGGRTWSEIDVLFDWGHHHPSMVVLPGGEIVMSYVVRLGYPNTPDGFPQMGIEAVVSRDHGRTWDLDHRYLLTTWIGRVKGPDGRYIAQSQSTSSVLLPDGSILTSYGGAHRAVRTVPGASEPREVGLVNWRVNPAPPRDRDRTIARAPVDSDLRNRLDLNRLNGIGKPAAPANAKRNIALADEGVRVTSSASDQPAFRVLRDEYVTNLVTLQSIPAWVELQWSKRRRIEEVRIHPGALAVATQPSTECVPLDYRLQYRKGRDWIDLVPPVSNAPRYRDFDPKQRNPSTVGEEFEYVHTFKPAWVKTLRLYVTRSSDSGKRNGQPASQAIPEADRETILRQIDVFESPRGPNQ